MARPRKIAIPGEAVEQAVERTAELEKPKASNLPTPDQVDSSKISHMVLTTEGWVAGACVPGGGR